MRFPFVLLLPILAILLCGPVSASVGSSQSAATRLVISVADQKLAIISDGEVVKKFPVSTSKFGIGDGYGSYKTPLGKLRVCQRIGEGMPEGMVFKRRVPTGEILPPNSSGRDPIVTRILWLDGQDSTNHNARNRGIYIHGTPQEKKIGRPASYGCVRMRSADILEIFPLSQVGTPVEIIKGPLPRSRDASWTERLFSELVEGLFRSF